MINRVLIRIKVVQILYSFLLVEKQFSLESCESPFTKEKRYSHALYMDMLLLMLRISESVSYKRVDYPLADTRFIKRLKNDDQIKSLVNKYRLESFPFEAVVEPLAEKVKDSAIYKNFLKNRDDNRTADDMVWSEIFNILIMPNVQVNAQIEKRENHTLKGVDRMRALVEQTFANFMASQDSVSDVLAALNESLNKANELYYRLLWLPVELTDMQERILDERRHRYVRTDEDLNPNLRFVENELVKRLASNMKLRNVVEKDNLSWEHEAPQMMNHLLKAILDSEIYRNYMESEKTGLAEDCEFWRNIFKRVIFTNEYFLETMEEESVYWNDDLDIIGTFVLKTLRRVEESESDDAVMDKFKDAEDAAFGSELVRFVLKNKETYRGYINDAVNKKLWESERLSFMDVVIMETALAEIFNFPKIPLTVSFNEYIEIAKSYGSNKSGGFINGLLGAVVSNLQQEGILHKR